MSELPPSFQPAVEKSQIDPEALQNFEAYKGEIAQAKVDIEAFMQEAARRVPALARVDQSVFANPLEFSKALMGENWDYSRNQVAQQIQAQGNALQPLAQPVGGNVSLRTLAAYQLVLSAHSNLYWAQKGLETIASTGQISTSLQPLYDYGRQHYLGSAIANAKEAFNRSLV